MTEFAYVEPKSSRGTVRLSDVEKIADSLKRGSLAILPTETGYMLAALATSMTALESAFTVKGRNVADVMHVACASLAMAETAGVLSQRAIRLLGDFMPGPLSVIVNKTDLLPDHLVALNGTVGIRVPDHAATLQVINAVGTPVTATSLNPSGSKPISVDRDSLQSLNWPENELIYVLRDDHSIAYDCASTLVRVSGGEAEILRVGPIPEAEILRVSEATS